MGALEEGISERSIVRLSWQRKCSHHAQLCLYLTPGLLPSLGRQQALVLQASGLLKQCLAKSICWQTSQTWVNPLYAPFELTLMLWTAEVQIKASFPGVTSSN